MAKKQETITIPMSLAVLLASEPEDVKDGVQYEQVQATAKALLRLLMAAK